MPTLFSERMLASLEAKLCCIVLNILSDWMILVFCTMQCQKVKWIY